MPLAALAVALLVTAAPTAAGQVLQQIDEIVTRSFYSKGQLARVDWRSLVEKARAKLATARSEDARDAILEDLVAGLKTSHTEYLPRSRPEYWDIASIFESFLKNARKRCAPGEFPPIPAGDSLLPEERRPALPRRRRLDRRRRGPRGTRHRTGRRRALRRAVLGRRGSP